MANTTHRPVTEAIEYPDCDGRPIGEDTLHFDWIVRIEQWLEFIEERRRSNDLQSLRAAEYTRRREQLAARLRELSPDHD